MAVRFQGSACMQEAAGTLTPAQAVLKSTSGYSCSLWLNITSSPGTSISSVLYRQTASGGNPTPAAIRIEGSSPVSGAVQGSITAFGNSGVTAYATTTAAIVAGSWYFVCATWQGTKVTLYAWRYQSGTMNSLSIGGSGTGTLDTDTASNVWYISTNGPATTIFAGSIYNVNIWQSCLSQDEARAMAWGARPETVRPASLIAHWPLEGLVASSSGSQWGEGLAAGYWGSGAQVAYQTGNEFPIANPPPTGIQVMGGLGYRYGGVLTDTLGGVSQAGFRSPLAILPSMISGPPISVIKLPPFQLRAA